ncbi:MULTISPECIES: SGNH/GDSL hydrolase family protein [unclassified Mesorhizobium]|uniref:SGNH/GDSL hydrolase family protein n=1 Tax=unclassified Mesorhizobium TaxID=325217 RepID=UPI00095DAEE3|nr:MULTISPECIES: SGNH/GDSL hydrolase family protein [unclassified Mesorhizobium]MBN9253053.1 SGNH/GDSL hydrolase family protein [Mesorhizobium sp.]OJX82684.1 MAG: lipase [Mesorhizobium sp. 65-26]
MPHVVLLGDSIFDNGGYVGDGPDVASQLRSTLPTGWRVSLHAVDGSVTGDVKRQLGWLGSDVTHLVLSIGGNDALDHGGILGEPSSSVAEVLDRLATIRENFARNYNAMLDTVTATNRPLAVCTIYDGRFVEPMQRRIANTALSLFNDTITRAAFSRGLTLIDLRLICDQDEDLANPIEPSVQGGRKIARAIAAFCEAATGPRSNSEVLVR